MGYSSKMRNLITVLLGCLLTTSVIETPAKAGATPLLAAAATASHCEPQSNRLAKIEQQNPNIKCAILIDDDLKFPRNLVTHQGDIWLVDKGSNLFANGAKSGAIYHYQAHEQGYRRTQVLRNLDDPNDIAIRQHASGEYWAYFTTRASILRFKITDPDRIAPEVLIDNLPTYGWHKLMALNVTQSNVYLTMPSLTDHCEVEALPGLVEYPCGETTLATATIRNYQFDKDSLDGEYTVLANGLRDALATAISPNGNTLIAADNGWDQINLNETSLEYKRTPHDEINVIDLTRLGSIPHFGWPYCYDQASITPPYRRFVDSCKTFQPPTILLPAHSAPLSMGYFGEELLVNLHGNNESGAKTVAFSLDNNGLPKGEPSIKIDWRYQGKTDKEPRLGRPLGLTALSESELLITDDWNHQLIKIVFNDE